MEREFNVGDHVTIVDEPYRGCPFRWGPEMDEFCSMDVIIRIKGWDVKYRTYYYEIDADDGLYNWCAGCFKQSNPPDFEIASDEEMLEMLGIRKKEGTE